MSKLPDIVDFNPTGNNVLIELINNEELLPESSIELVGEAASEMTKDYGAPQAYVLAVGPTVKPEEWGFKVGDRVAFSDRMTPLPPVPIKGDTPETLDVHSKPKRARGLIMPNGVKAVLFEKGHCCCKNGCCKKEKEDEESLAE